KTQNDFLREWLPVRDDYLAELLDRESCPEQTKCELCGKDDGPLRCTTCSGIHSWCSPCIVKAHARLPFHKIQSWNGEYFEDTSLFDQGFVWHLGHGGGVCPNGYQSEMGGWVDMGDEDDQGDPVVEMVSETPGETKLVLVHSTGIFTHCVAWCCCSHLKVKRDHQLLRAGLFPSSVVRPKTAFTFEVLDHFLIDALECKTSAMGFFEKLKRLTSNSFPHMVPDRYRELMRVSRMWRDLQNRKRFGYGHNVGSIPGPGGLSLFCPACPQPGVNLPGNWVDIYKSWLVMPRFVVDGNFSAQHMKMKRPEDDVSLTDGEGYMVAEGPYAVHMKASVESKEKSSCHNHRAVNAANCNRKNLRATGVGATACARHGCFVPGTVVDFQKGERQMNIDYSICNALKFRSEGITKALIIYDVSCQWIIHFLDRVAQSPYLSVPEKMAIFAAVGKFHLSAHKLQCFARFSLNFIEGAGQIDGEILETLWAPFNKISPTARSMSQAHRREVYDDHMRDSNWKKLVGIVKTLLKKYSRAIKGLDETKEPYLLLTSSLSPSDVAKWALDEKQAAEQRGDALDVYQLRFDRAPTMAEIRLTLTGTESENGGQTGSIAWLVSGINLENAQDSLRAELRKLPSDATTSQKVEVEEKRQRLLARLIKFHQTADTVTEGVDHGTAAEAPADDQIFTQHEGDVEFMVDGEEVEELDETEAAESMGIWMPSSMDLERAQELGLEKLQQDELQLRVGQANDSLEGLRMALGRKAVLYRKTLRSADSVFTGTRSKKLIEQVNAKMNKHIRSYQRARKAIRRLSRDETIIGKYREITVADLSVNQDVTEENRYGQGSDKMAWFWIMGQQNGDQSDAWMNEFYRVNWLKAKARYLRWEEELEIVRHEMDWVVRWFSHQEQEWKRWATQSQRSGQRAYAEKQVNLWGRFKEEAQKGFKGKMVGS
ncbi:hypothetical protein BV22DRAFT_1022428, partial [Leucogyrophana mollusca]